jgi:hypothetical protein
MSTALTTTDIVPSSVPKLMLTGVNWTVIRSASHQGQGVSGPLRQDNPVASTGSISPTQEEIRPLHSGIAKEKTVRALLTHRIPDSTLTRIHGKTLLKERWEWLTCIVLTYLSRPLILLASCIYWQVRHVDSRSGFQVMAP